MMAFSWYVRSRSLYHALGSDLFLPSISTLRKITRMAKNTEDSQLYQQIFMNAEPRSRGCILLVDEVYVKASITYSGGSLFGQAVDDPSKKARTLLCIYVKCLFGGPKFMAKMIPCAALTAAFQFECVQEIILLLESCGGKVLTVINDGNKVNQTFFSMFCPFNDQIPWIVRSLSQPSRPLFLIYDSVNLLKNLRNNWLTEATGTLSFKPEDSEDSCHAKWEHLRDLYKHESSYAVNGTLALSALTKASVCPVGIGKTESFISPPSFF